MADYAIGDIQGCYDPLQRLLEHIGFDDTRDRLWLVGDLVNRGPDSLSVLRFIQQLAIAPRVTLGNHDLYLLDCLMNRRPSRNPDDTLDAILNAPDREDISLWLRQQPLMYHDSSLRVAMVHAGIPPMWGLREALAHAHEVETILQSSQCADFLTHMYGNTPNHWSDDLTGHARFRVICNYFTRMRFCDKTGGLANDFKGAPHDAVDSLYPWFAHPHRQRLDDTLIFGHWAALQGKCPIQNLYALDTGCVWGGSLTALRLQDKQQFHVSGV